MMKRKLMSELTYSEKMQEELEPIRNKEEDSKPVTKHTRAKRAGTLLLCPECKKTNRIYHFSWVAIVCLNCKAEVNKYDWRIANEQT